MRSLFFKIFIWFWLANILVAGVLVLTTGGVPREPHRGHFRAMMGDMLELHGERALAALERGGMPAMRHSIDESRHRTGLHVFIIAQDGSELAGQPLPPGVDELARSAREGEETPMGDDRGGGLMLARAARGHPGLMFVLGLPPGPMPRLMERPYGLLLRIFSVLSLAGLLCWGLARYLTAPLRRLQSSARQLADGDLSVRVGPRVGRRHDEIGDLGRDFDFMAERIESLVSTQQELIRDLSHELRSPLARLDVAVELVERRVGPEAAVPLDRIRRESGRLNELIGRMLTLARLESRASEAATVEVDLEALVREIAADADYEAKASGRGVSLADIEACRLQGHPAELRSAVENVLRNAVRYTPDGSTVELSLACTPEPEPHAVLRIRDHGPGVPEDSLAEIFRPFCRVHEDRGRQTGGVGLGLAIARQAVLLHGGTITAANHPEGGLIVEITLPACT